MKKKADAEKPSGSKTPSIPLLRGMTCCPAMILPPKQGDKRGSAFNVNDRVMDR